MISFLAAFLLLLCMTVAVVIGNEEKEVVELSPEILEACAGDKVDTLKALIEANPAIVNGRSEQGETCLHVAAITDAQKMTRLLLESGADPNVRSTFEHGQRMTPLTFNVYSWNVENVRALLENGADVNMDVDWARNGGEMVKATAMDIVLDALPADDSVTEGTFARLFELKAVMEEFNAKRYEDLQHQGEF